MICKSHGMCSPKALLLWIWGATCVPMVIGILSMKHLLDELIRNYVYSWLWILCLIIFRIPPAYSVSPLQVLVILDKDQYRIHWWGASWLWPQNIQNEAYGKKETKVQPRNKPTTERDMASWMQDDVAHSSTSWGTQQKGVNSVCVCVCVCVCGTFVCGPIVSIHFYKT